MQFESYIKTKNSKRFTRKGDFYAKDWATAKAKILKRVRNPKTTAIWLRHVSTSKKYVWYGNGWRETTWWAYGR